MQIGLLGLGTVGKGVEAFSRMQACKIANAVREEVCIGAIAVRDLSKNRGPDVPVHLLTDDYMAVAVDPHFPVIVSLMGDEAAELEAIQLALEVGKKVVIANKRVLARHYHTLAKLVGPPGAVPALYYEAAAGGAIHVLHALRTRHVADDITAFSGIVNGTCNYILFQMEQGMGYEQALVCAQKLGYAEPDPTDDISGNDSACKLWIISRLAFGVFLDLQTLHIQGITRVREQDFRYVRDLGYQTIRLIAHAHVHEGQELETWVSPAVLGSSHRFVRVAGAQNALLFNASYAGEFMLEGQGAGGMPTASAVWSDIILACQAVKNREHFLEHEPVMQPISLISKDALEGHYYIRITMSNAAGSLGVLGNILGAHGVSIEAVHQDRTAKWDGLAEAALTTETSSEGALRAALRALQEHPICQEIGAVLRILD